MALGLQYLHTHIHMYVAIKQTFEKSEETSQTSCEANKVNNKSKEVKKV